MKLRLALGQHIQREGMIQHCCLPFREHGKVLIIRRRQFISHAKGEFVRKGFQATRNYHSTTTLKVQNKDVRRSNIRQFTDTQETHDASRVSPSPPSDIIDRENLRALSDISRRMKEFINSNKFITEDSQFLTQYYHDRDELLKAFLRYPQKYPDTVINEFLIRTVNSYVTLDVALVPLIVRLIDQFGTASNLSNLFTFQASTGTPANICIEQLPSIGRLDKNSKGIVKLKENYRTYEILTTRKAFHTQQECEQSVRQFFLFLLQFESMHAGFETLATQMFSQIIKEVLIQNIMSPFQVKDMLLEFTLKGRVSPQNYSSSLIATLIQNLRNSHLEELIGKQPFDRKLQVMSDYMNFGSDQLSILKCWLFIFDFKAFELNFKAFPRELTLLKDVLFKDFIDLDVITKIQEYMGDENLFSEFLSTLIFGFTKFDNYSEANKLMNFKMSISNAKIFDIDSICMIIFLNRLGKHDAAYQILSRLENVDSVLIDETFADLIKILKYSGHPDYVNTIMNNVVSSPEFPFREDLQRTLLECLSHVGNSKQLAEAWKLYTRKGFEPSVDLLSNIIEGLIENKYYTEALRWFRGFSEYKIKPNTRTYELMITALAGSKDIKGLFILLDELLKLDSKSVAFTKKSFAPLLNIIASDGDYNVVCTITEYYIPKFNISKGEEDYRYMAQALYHSKRYNDVFEQFESLLSVGIVDVDQYYYVLLSASEHSYKVFRKYWKLLYLDERFKNFTDVRLHGVYLSRYVLEYGLNNIETKIRDIEVKYGIQCSPDTFNGMIESCVKRNAIGDIFTLIRIMKVSGINMNAKTYSIISSCTFFLNSYQSSETKVRYITQIKNILQEILPNNARPLYLPSISPSALLFFIRGLIHYGDYKSAEMYYRVFLTTYSADNADNIPLLAAELLISGSRNSFSYEAKKNFKQKFAHYIDTIKPKLKKENVTNDKFIDARSTTLNRSLLPSGANIISPVKSNRGEVSIEVETALVPVWSVLLQNLVKTHQLQLIIPLVPHLRSLGFLITDQMITETALLFARQSDLFKQAIVFIDQEILPNKASGALLTERSLLLNAKVKMNHKDYALIISELMHTLTQTTKENERRKFFEDIRDSNKHSILKYLEVSYNNKTSLLFNWSLFEVLRVRRRVRLARLKVGIRKSYDDGFSRRIRPREAYEEMVTEFNKVREKMMKLKFDIEYKKLKARLKAELGAHYLSTKKFAYAAERLYKSVPRLLKREKNKKRKIGRSRLRKSLHKAVGFPRAIDLSPFDVQRLYIIPAHTKRKMKVIRQIQEAREAKYEGLDYDQRLVIRTRELRTLLLRAENLQKRSSLRRNIMHTLKKQRERKEFAKTERKIFLETDDKLIEEEMRDVKLIRDHFLGKRRR